MEQFNQNNGIFYYLVHHTAPQYTENGRDRKLQQMSGDQRILTLRDELRSEADWPCHMSLIYRDEPDERGFTITVLPNRDTIAALLAVRLGISPHLAVALAHADMIRAGLLNDGQFRGFGEAPAELISLATFQPSGSSHSEYALLVRKDVRKFKFVHKPEEVLLIHQHPEQGLFWGGGSYDHENMVNVLDYRTDESVFYEFDPASHS